MRKTSSGLVVAALLQSSTYAIKFRPIAGTVPWHEDIKKPEWVDPQDHKIDYFVPNFGMDSDIKASMKNTEQAETDLGHNMTTTDEYWEPKKLPWGKDYSLHHFGEDDEIKTSKKNLAEAEEKLDHVMVASFEEPDGPKRNYFVPHFGEDNEVKDTKQSLALVEKDMDHELTIPEKEDEKKKNYFVPNFGADTNIVASMKNLDDSEKGLSHELKVHVDGDGSFTLLQTEAEMNLESDPICSSAGCDQYKHKTKPLGYNINYPVANFGRDHDINDNHASLGWAENSLNHKWTWKEYSPQPDPVTYYDGGPMDGDVAASIKHLNEQEGIHGAWDLPPKDYVGIQLDENLNMIEELQNVQLEQQLMAESDPVCSSAGCVQYLHKQKALGYKIDYPVPNFGADMDIIDSKASLDKAEQLQSHELDLPNGKWKKSKFVKYPYEDPIDEDAIDTMKNLDDAEKELAHKWVI